MTKKIKSDVVWYTNNNRSRPEHGEEVLIYGPSINVMSAFCSLMRDGSIGWYPCFHDKQAIDDTEVKLWTYYPHPTKD